MGIATAAVIGATLFSANEQRQAGKRNARLQERAQSAQRRREITQSLRERRIAAGQAVAGASGSGNMGSSAVQGSISSNASQASASIGFANQIGQINTQINQNTQRANDRIAVAGLVSQAAQGLGQYQQMKALQTNSVPKDK